MVHASRTNKILKLIILVVVIQMRIGVKIIKFFFSLLGTDSCWYFLFKREHCVTEAVYLGWDEQPVINFRLLQGDTWGPRRCSTLPITQINPTPDHCEAPDFNMQPARAAISTESPTSAPLALLVFPRNISGGWISILHTSKSK